MAAQFDAAATATGPLPGHGERHRRRNERRKLIRQQLVVVAVLLLALIITLLVLGQQWLNSGSSSGAVRAPGASINVTANNVTVINLTGEPI